ncbi:glutaredoxin 3 [Candidatus Pelagibacter sp.]|jgi:glutaredoxin 3|nr:glutaredoxin 3 [Candidatus Pelagibacter sp.]|tara:strand:- start:55 stop:315 length:261 start_codon:yes stop_codon:yes gene_type:complete
MKNITVYSGPMCNFCDAAKRLLVRNNLEYTEIDISTKEGLREEMTKKANGRRTIPQIFFDDYHVGGYTELRELEKKGKLLTSVGLA